MRRGYKAFTAVPWLSWGFLKQDHKAAKRTGGPDHSSHWTRRESPTDCGFKSLGEMTPFPRLKSTSKDPSVSTNGVEMWQPSLHRVQRKEQLAGGTRSSGPQREMDAQSGDSSPLKEFNGLTSL